MAEAAIFIILGGIVTVSAFYVLNITGVHPAYIAAVFLFLIAPGLYAAFTSGPFVPSARKRHKTMIKMADFTGKEVAYDLGCGVGRLVFSASKFAKKAIGYDLSIPLILYGKLISLFHPKSQIRFGNIWTQNYDDADIIFCYLLPNAMTQFYKEVWPNLKPGTRVISNAFQIHEVKPKHIENKVYLYER